MIIVYLLTSLSYWDKSRVWIVNFTNSHPPLYRAPDSNSHPPLYWAPSFILGTLLHTGHPIPTVTLLYTGHPPLYRAPSFIPGTRFQTHITRGDSSLERFFNHHIKLLYSSWVHFLYIKIPFATIYKHD